MVLLKSARELAAPDIHGKNKVIDPQKSVGELGLLGRVAVPSSLADVILCALSDGEKKSQ